MRRRINAPLLRDGNAVAGGRTMDEWRRLNASRAIAAGDSPFRYWFMQACIPIAKLETRSGVAASRLLDLERGDAMPTAEEAALLAPIFRIDPSDLLP
jgi:transcriptional regulator with XRE-family HTH domain